MAEYVVDRENVWPYGSQREEVVRCRDCEHYRDHEWVMVTDVSDVCHFWHGEPTKVEPDGFCKWGVRKVDA
jgi:hypothetical protein